MDKKERTLDQVCKFIEDFFLLSNINNMTTFWFETNEVSIYFKIGKDYDTSHSALNGIYAEFKVNNLFKENIYINLDSEKYRHLKMTKESIKEVLLGEVTTLRDNQIKTISKMTSLIDSEQQ